MRLVAISNRVPLPTAISGAGGLAVGLRDALAEFGGIWFGWSGSRTTERESSPSVVQEDNISFATLPLTDQDFERYYAGYANSVLWPLFHERLHAMEYHEAFRIAYEDVNAYFGQAAATLLQPDDVVWIHDYHLIPLGRELRDRGAAGRIGFFLHTPFPPSDVFRALPERKGLLRSFFAYDLVGFQTPWDVRHFAESLARELGAKVELSAEAANAAGTATLDGRTIRFSAFPIGIDVTGTAQAALTNRGNQTGQRLTRALRGRKLIIGADRLDYTKGLVERFQAFELFLDKHRDEMDDAMIYIQITAPSRQNVPEYQEINRQLEAEAGRINGRNNTVYWTPLRLIERDVSREVLLGYFSLAHVGLVTPLRDGMNLVAKEFVASQTGENPGVLVLSSLAGAAEELADCAVVVNPYSPDQVADGIYRALNMPLAERRERWERGMESLTGNTATTWRQAFLSALIGAEPA
ncbi:MAG: alpha,alpha-trehalose-phosphate synthase (UDP-forming) [Pseudomonadales bacterium]